MEDFYFKLDDWVKLKNFRKEKFQFTWKGPFIIHGYGYYPTYWLRTPDGQILKNLVNQTNLAPWTVRLDDNEDYFLGFQPDEDLGAFPGEEDDVSGMDGCGSSGSEPVSSVSC